MGPKEVFGEYLDEELQGGVPLEQDYPWVGLYDGEVLPSPELDYNFEISKYSFETSGEHRVQWRIGGCASNTVVLTVK